MSRRRLAPDELSPSELTILHLLANGRQPGELAAELHLTPNTIRVHRRRALCKLGADNLHDAVLTALRTHRMRPDAIVTGPLRFMPQLAAAHAKLNAVRAFADGLETGGYPDIARELRKILDPPNDRNSHARPQA